MAPSINNVDSFFRGGAEKYIFALLYLDTEMRMNVLGIKKVHYEDPEFTKIWRNKILRVLERSKHPQVLEAISKLNDLYIEMTGDEE
jgi:hypothetical protein